MSLFLCCLAPALASDKKGDAPAGFEPAKVKKRLEPFYPNWAYTRGIGQGYAELACYVDENGETSDYLFLEYSHLAFAEELLKTVKKWQFTPAHRFGKPVKSVVRAYWEFYPDRPIETNSLFDTAKRINRSDAKAYRELQSVDESELDTKLQMLRFPPVALPRGYQLAEPDKGGITVTCSFYVDQNGNVALPWIERSSDPELNHRVIDSLHQTLFDRTRADGEAAVAWLYKTYLIPVAPARPSE